MTETTTARETDMLVLATDIETWLKGHMDESGADRFVLGLSGGIDSAVVCGLAARAVGPDRVLGVLMPSASNPDDAVSAGKVAEAFGVPSLTVDLSMPTQAMFAAFPSREALGNLLGLAAADDPRPTQLAEANVKPRLRMTTVYYIANHVRGIVLGTGNRSEAMIGYYTKYGDGGVDLLPIIDLYKHEVREVARAIGVPQSVIDRPPSAGLWEGQTDEDELGMTYEDLDATLAAISSGDTSGADPALLERVRRMMDVSQHKRAPIPTFRRG